MSDLEYLGKVKGLMTFKEQEQTRPLKHMVVQASELVANKQAEIDRSETFTRSATDESFYNRTEPSVSPVDPSPIGVRVGIITREPFEDLP
ncbi:hypothetical protein G6735_07925 [Polynucleobacter paneuropaeus]|nr:hypothetical protein [Polynucleobacter paneuropaeus]